MPNAAPANDDGGDHMDTGEEGTIVMPKLEVASPTIHGEITMDVDMDQTE